MTAAEMEELERWIDSDAENKKYFVRVSALFSSDKLSPDYVVKRLNKSAWTFLLIIGAIGIISLIAWNIVPSTENMTLEPAALSDTNSKPYSAPGVVIGKDSLIKFKNATVKNIMGAIGYCYKVPVVYQGKMSVDTYSASITCTMAISEMIGILKLVGIKADYDGKRITVGE